MEFSLVCLAWLASLACTRSELVLKLWMFERQFVELLGWGISPSQGRHLDRTRDALRLVSSGTRVKHPSVWEVMDRVAAVIDLIFIYCKILLRLTNTWGLDWILDLLYTCRLHRLWLQFTLWCSRQYTQLHYSLSLLIHSLLSVVHYTSTESSWSAVPHYSSGTGFQRWTFTFLGSRTIPFAQPQQLLTRDMRY
jgi:hypothetical protein